jgi:replicative DNA helicase
LAADNDKSGHDANKAWAEKLQAIGVACQIVDVAKLYGGEKDANDALRKDKAGLMNMIQEAEGTRKAEPVNPWAGGVKSLIDKVKCGNYLPTPTGIENLDRLLGGGFINQQIIGITGRPGAGKTAFCQWLAESMAIGREDYCALYLCFEMSAEQLQARSISRLMHEAGENLTPLEVLQGKGQWLKGAQMYEDLYAKKVLYVGMGGGLQSNDITEVERVISECIRYKISQGQPVPFVVLDYLQIISVAGMNEFEAIGTIMARLKGLAVKYNAVILIVIANNRDSNKKGEFDMFSGRGSGSI